MDIIFNVQLLLSREKIKTMTVNLEKIPSINDENLTKLPRLKKETKEMNIFFITFERDMVQMKNLTNKLNLSKAINLLFFMKSGNSTLLKFCMNPIGNPFSVSDGTIFHVKCYNDTIIREWHILDTNEMNVYKWAKWEPKTRRLLQLKNSRFKESYTLKGKVLFTATIAVKHKTTMFLLLKFSIKKSFSNSE